MPLHDSPPARPNAAWISRYAADLLDSTPSLAPNAAILVANETEFELLSGRGIAELDDAMTDWAAAHNQTLIVTLGGDGAKAAVDGKLIHVPALPVKPVDTG